MAAPVKLAGWDASRTDGDPKYAFGRFAQDWIAQGKPYNADAVRTFVSGDPRWEIDQSSSADDPKIRVKQSELDTWKPGQSIYQDVIRDAGGASAPQFLNAGGGPAPAPAMTAADGSGWWAQNAPRNAQGSVGSLVTQPLTPALAVPGRGSVGAVLGGY